MNRSNRPNNNELKTSELSALSHGVESLVRRLIRLLIGHMSLIKFEEMVRLVFVEEVEIRLREEFPDKTVSLAQLALLTGLDTRVLGKIRNHTTFKKDRRGEASFMHNVTPTTRLLDKWSTDLAYLDKKTNDPLPITVLGESTSIEHLMKEARFVRGITPKSIAERLKLSGAATQDKETGCLHMVTEKFLPSASSDAEGAIEIGFNSIAHLMDTVFINLEELESGTERLYQRTYWTNRLAPHQQAQFKKELIELMQKFEEQGTCLLHDYELKIESPSLLTAGFGLFYFEDENSA